MVAPRAWLLGLLLATGCRQILGLHDLSHDPDGGDHRDGSGSDSSDTPAPEAGSMCFGKALEQVCLVALPSTPLTIAIDTTLDTATDTICAPTTSATVDACVVVGTSITIAARLRAVGARPLVLVATDSIDVTATGLVDVSSLRTDPGAAASSALCTIGTDASVSGGAAGGSFGTKGGNGGNGANGGNPGTAGTVVGATIVRGGCRGGTGGGGSGGGGNGGLGGPSGGAVYLIASSLIQITGSINASGAGGGGGVTNSAGGGGGGSGGMIGLDASTVTILQSGRVFANGGGGGEGAGTNATGGAGTESTAPGTRANGGSGGNQNAGDGGRGASNGSDGDGGMNGQSTAGGGGGGGGVGVFKVDATSVNINGQVSPPPS